MHAIDHVIVWKSVFVVLIVIIFYLIYLLICSIYTSKFCIILNFNYLLCLFKLRSTFILCNYLSKLNPWTTWNSSIFHWLVVYNWTLLFQPNWLAKTIVIWIHQDNWSSHGKIINFICLYFVSLLTFIAIFVFALHLFVMNDFENCYYSFAYQLYECNYEINYNALFVIENIESI